MSYQEPDEISAKVFGAYDQFLTMLDDEGIRKELDGLAAEDAASNATFQKVRDLSHQFQDGLTHLFFENVRVAPLTRKYGVF